MKAWNEFIAKDEQEQLEILENAVSNANSEEKGWCVVGGKPTPSKNTPDARKHHPAYSGKACFERLDKKSKQILLSRKVNWALVDHLERELRSLFCSPGSPGDEEIVYVGHYPAASDRALAHTVAQYLWLTSQSVTIPGTLDRLTEFRNSRSFFIPPRICLIPYVESVLNKRIDFVPFSARGDDLLEDFGRLSMSSGQDSPKLDLTMSSDTASDEETHLD
ncbi:unnamed protein product [Caenorhabditis auriculariae]|uniref:R3H-associated N-terminal domain-containing protein n=1 Tax=Caenorhabditis auriculariae TaxID=2777116 RepID=A0A8S1HP16_9PELO|nr:unnamed protein product [Caenorhabditis auriculariae]